MAKDEVINESNSNLLNTVYNSKQYIQNQEQINCISKILVEHADVPQKLVDWLIDSVKENTKLELQSKK